MKNLVIYFAFFSSFISFSQEIKVVGSESNKAIEGVAVLNEDQSKVKYSDINGLVDISSFKENEIITFNALSFIEFEILKRDIKALNNKIVLIKDAEVIDEILIHSASKGAEKRKRLAEQIVVTTKYEIEREMVQSSADLLATIPSIKVQKSQFGGGSPVLRGMEANRVLLVVDGVRMNNAIYRKGHLQNSITVSPTSLEKTEVVYGPSSVLYGSDALGGVIHYYTKTPKISKEKQLNGNLYSKYSSVNNAFTSHVGLEYSSSKFATYTSFSHSKFGDLKMGTNRNHGFENWGKIIEYSDNTNTFYNAFATENNNENIQKNTGYHQTDFVQKVTIPFSEKTTVNLNYQYSNSSEINRFDKLNEYTSNGDLKFSEWYYGPQKRILIATQIELNPSRKFIDKGLITLSFQNIHESRVQRKFNSLNRSYRNEKVKVFGINGDFSVPLTSSKKRILSYGFEMTHNDVKSDSEGRTLNINGNEIIGFSNTFSVQSRYPDDKSYYTSAALYLNYRQDVNEKTTLNSGVRFTDTYLRARWNDDTFITLPDFDIGLSNSAFTATFGYIYKPIKNLQFNAVLSSGFRSPNIDDIGKIREKNGDVTVPNVLLRPEYAYSAELGLLKYFNKKKFYVGWNMYYTLLDNYIVREGFTLNGENTIVYDGEQGNIVANVNKDNAYIIGGTLSFKGKINDSWKTKGSVTYTHGKTYDTKQYLSSIPPLFGNFEIGYQQKKLESSLSVVFNARKNASKYNTEEGIDNLEQSPLNPDGTFYGTPQWFTLNYYTGYELKSNINLQFSVNNIFDTHYKDFASSISSPGRNFSLAAKLTF